MANDLAEKLAAIHHMATTHCTQSARAARGGRERGGCGGAAGGGGAPGHGAPPAAVQARWRVRRPARRRVPQGRWPAAVCRSSCGVQDTAEAHSRGLSPAYSLVMAMVCAWIRVRGARAIAGGGAAVSSWQGARRGRGTATRCDPGGQLANSCGPHCLHMQHQASDVRCEHFHVHLLHCILCWGRPASPVHWRRHQPGAAEPEVEQQVEAQTLCSGPPSRT